MAQEQPTQSTSTDSSVGAEQGSQLASFFADTVSQSNRWAGDMYSRVTAEYATTVDVALLRRGWAFDTAKSYAYYNQFDQSMVAHTRAYVTSLVQIVRHAPDAIYPDETSLRNLVGMGVIHDIHKLHESETDEFDIPVEDVAEFAESIGVRDLAPDLTDYDLHSAAVGMHKNSGYKGSLTQRFLDYKDTLRLADACASNVNPNDVCDDFHPKLLRNAYCDTSYTFHAHDIGDVDGSLSSLLNGAVYDVLSDRGYNLVEVYENGCTYVAPTTDSDPANPATLSGDGVTFINSVYRNLRRRIRESYYSYRNKNVLTESLEVSQGNGFYRIDSIDKYALSKEDLLRAIVQSAILDSDTRYELTDSAKDEMELVNEMTEDSFELTMTYRLESLARLVHTLYRSVAPELVDESDPSGADYERHPVLAIFHLLDPSPSSSDEETSEAEMESDPWIKMMHRVADLYEEHEYGDKESLNSKNSWPYKYIIAQALLEYYFNGRTEAGIGDKISGELVELAQDFDDWDTFRSDQVGDIETELRALIAREVTVDESRALEDKATLSAFDDFIAADTKPCGICGQDTTGNKDWNRPRLVKGEIDKSTRVLINGNEKQLSSVCSSNAICYACQLDISIRRQHDNWADKEAVYTHLKPSYSYVPLNQTVFNLITSRITSAVADQGGSVDSELTSLPFGSDLSWYQNKLDEVISGVNGEDMLTNLTDAFHIDTGFGPVARRLSTPDRDVGSAADDLVMSVYGVALATLYSGCQAHLTRCPVLSESETSREQQEILKLNHGFESVHEVYGTALPIDGVGETLRDVAATKRLTEAAGYAQQPVSSGRELTEDSLLTGSALLYHARMNGADASTYARSSNHLDARTAGYDTHAGSIGAAAATMGRRVRRLADDSSTEMDGSGIVRVVSQTLRAVSEVDANQHPQAMRQVVREQLVDSINPSTSDSGQMTESYDAHEYAYALVDVLFGDVCNWERECLRQHATEIVQRAVTGAWATPLAVETDRNPDYEEQPSFGSLSVDQLADTTDSD